MAAGTSEMNHWLGREEGRRRIRAVQRADKKDQCSAQRVAQSQRVSEELAQARARVSAETVCRAAFRVAGYRAYHFG